MSENNLLFEETEKECQSKKRKINEYFNLPTILFIPFIACKKIQQLEIEPISLYLKFQMQEFIKKHYHLMFSVSR